MKWINLFLTGFLCVFLLTNTCSQEYDFYLSGGKLAEPINSPVYEPDESKGDVYLSDVPRYSDGYGWAPVSTAMLVGYYDKNGYNNMYTGPANGGVAPATSIEWWGDEENPIAATHMGVDGGVSRGHVDDYWSSNIGDPDPFIVNNWIEHEWEDCTGDFMGTSQDYWFQDVWNPTDGFTRFYFEMNGYKLEDYKACENENPPKKDGCHGLRDFIESRDYTVLENYSQLIYEDGMVDGFTFENYKNEIDNGRPVIIHLFPWVSVVGTGYNNDGNTVILHNGSDSDVHTMTWGETYANMDSYGVTVIKLKPLVPGVNDYVKFINSLPTVLEFDKPFPPYYYQAQFFDVEEPSNTVWWEFTLALYHDNNEEYNLFFEHENASYTYNGWEIPTITDLPQYNWIRNLNGNIDGYAKVEVLDSDGYYHSDEIPIEFLFGPSTPQIVGAFTQNNSLFLSYITMGADEYQVYYDTDPGPPYNGTGANQGSSPIDAGNLTTFEISGLQGCDTYYFAVKAQNEHGESVYSGEREIHLISSIDPSEIVRYHFNDLVFNQYMYNTTLTGNHYFNGDLIVQSGMTLPIEGGTLYFEENSKIIIEPGGKLILDGTTVTAPCGQSWPGIEVWGDPELSQYEYDGICEQGILELKGGATIENAVTGVLLGAIDDEGNSDDTKAGGIIIADFVDNENEVAYFINNKWGIRFRPYHNFHPLDPNQKEKPNLSFIENCTFDVNQDYVMGSWWYSHIHLYSVNGIRIRGNTFVNNKTTNPLGHGINSYRAGYKAEAICDNIISPCPDESLVKNTFANFAKGINMIYPGSYTLTAKNSIFTNNSTGIVLIDVNNASLLFNDFELGESNDGDGGLCGGKSASYGIDMTNCMGFAVEENNFSKATGASLGNYIGIRVTACPSKSDVIYKNSFDGVSVGNQAEDFNRPEGGLSTTGVTYLCNQNTENSYDFYVADESVVSGYMGWDDEPSGNTLSPGAEVQFQNDYTEPIIYYYKLNEDDEKLQTHSTTVYPVAIDYTNTCPSHYGGINPKNVVLSPEQKLEAEQDYATNLTDYNNVKALFDNLKDGGNTEATLTDVSTAWPNDMWELRAKLLGDSPHLSMEVLKAASDKTDVLPESVLFEILSANPDELKKEELIKYLEDKQNPLPAYMVDILRQLANGNSYKTVLLSEMAAYNVKKVGAAQDIVRSILNSDEPDMDELRNWMDNIGSMEADKQIIDTYISEGNYTSAQSLIDMLPGLYELEGDALLAYNDYQTFTGMMMDIEQDGRTIYSLSDTELATIVDIAENGYGSAKTSAQGLLEFAYGYDYCNCPDLPEGIELKSSNSIDPDKLAQAKGLNITVEPNPVNTWAALNYSLPLTEIQAVIKITDNSGKTVKQIQIDQQQGQYVLDTRSYKSGIYYYTITCADLQRTGKLIVQ